MCEDDHDIQSCARMTKQQVNNDKRSTFGIGIPTYLSSRSEVTSGSGSRLTLKLMTVKLYLDAEPDSSAGEDEEDVDSDN